VRQLIYNTFSRSYEEFVPADPRLVKVYVCGPTPYDFSHIGHGRTFAFFDTAIRWLRESGYTVLYVMNITDIDDKMIKRSAELGISWEEFKEYMTREFFYDMELLNVHAVSLYVRATDVIPEIISFVQQLLDKGIAYVTSDGVYLEVSQLSDYGRLAGVRLEELTHHRIEPSPYKKHPADFALWKFKKPGEPSWQAPWGEGRPGWHIECAAMILRYLGGQVDIHGGGADLIFPHHENERAEMLALTGKEIARYWMHVAMVKVEGEKMSKSLGNIVPLRQLVKEAGTVAARWYLLSAHYRKPLDFSWDEVDKYKKLVQRLRAVEQLLSDVDAEIPRKPLPESLQELLEKIYSALANDFDTPVALANFYSLLTEAEKQAENLENEQKVLLLHHYTRIARVFGFLLPGAYLERKLLQIIAAVRDQLRERKLYELSDAIRAELIKLGYRVVDTAKGSKIY